jgi:uncharacterized RDD family membrane protein YckC
MTDQPGQNPDPTPPDPTPPDPTPPDPSVPPPPPPPAPTPPGDYTAPPPPVPGYGTPPPTAPPGGPAPSSYGTPPAPGYQQPGPMPGYAVTPDPSLSLPFANWGSRVQSAFIDYIGVSIVAYIVFFISHPLGYILFLASAAWSIYNSVLGGQTGQSYGKKMAGTKLVSATTGQPIGGGMGFGRSIVHIVDGLPCYIGYLWPLWDAKRQTFADKIVGTYVLKV